MGIRDLLLGVGESYDAALGTGKGVPAQDLLRQAGEVLALDRPVGLMAKGYGGKGSAARTPWIGFFDPDITEDPKEGLYLAYIFAADLKTVALTLQQGVTKLMERLRGEELRAHLSPRAQMLRNALPADMVAGWDVRPDFNCNLARPLAYEAGSVVARIYELESLPSDSMLCYDLWHLADVLREAAVVADEVWAEGVVAEELQVGYVSTVHAPPVAAQRKRKPNGLAAFRPKDSSAYIAHIREQTIVKTRAHEDLINRFAEYIAQRGFTPFTDHPKDLELEKDGQWWLVEAKAIKLHNPTSAVREAVGQLFEYSHFLFEESDGGKPHLLALFTEDIKAYAPYLEGLGIASVWMTPGGWEGSPSAVSYGLVD
ncbi:MrcB family domain-containing protein [Streptomyces sp. NPDC053048]|uniref:MrcB family domain-containing protein n=1 Tax=Streptomyces sp. NPDC053048 TaxID=3365694 RepID=UPI0037D39CB9